MRTAAREPGVDDRRDRKCSDPVILDQWHPVAAVSEVRRFVQTIVGQDK